MRYYSQTYRFRYNDACLFFGSGVLREKLGEHVKNHRKALLITSKNAAKVSGALDTVVEALKRESIEYFIYDGVKANPYTSMADEAGRIAAENKVDLVIAIGGGSVIDTAKFASVIATTGFKAVEILTNPSLSSNATRLPLIAVNLTHGTGSEIDRYAVLTIDGTIEKRGVAVRYPDVSFDDPLYSRTLSKDQTIYTSLDAFYHSYEAATSVFSNLLTVTLSKEAIEIIAETLPKILGDLDNIEYRTKLLYASMIAGIAIDQSMTHLNHALEHAFSGLHPELPHGAGLAILGPMVVYYTHKAVPEVSAQLLKPLNPGIKPVSEDAEKAYKAVRDFQSSVGLDKRLSDYGIDRRDVEKAIEFTMRMINTRYTSIPFKPSSDVLRDIIEKSL
ncbi:iron-containing alcohol dehydrogenase [Desulfurococcus amylolyticus]|uniref:Iron-containing alcohol dehydrogenase n=1 Tax=Desulfurococcus amylolyticus DSM 16532 TaxID=768672 RepID=I3XQ90_DESAM|nr:iron-containing alcohol dehydrogenase [Desulfurococcus amylolyticus]AFL66114.1 iron-containing alcohol dehydrogenase [Desulfurococcus amylolyticus DSM 16532]